MRKGRPVGQQADEVEEISGSIFDVVVPKGAGEVRLLLLLGVQHLKTKLGRVLANYWSMLPRTGTAKLMPLFESRSKALLHVTLLIGVQSGTSRMSSIG